MDGRVDAGYSTATGPDFAAADTYSAQGGGSTTLEGSRSNYMKKFKWQRQTWLL